MLLYAGAGHGVRYLHGICKHGAGSQSLVGGSANNNISVDGEEAGACVVNQTFPLWAHATKTAATPPGRGGNTTVSLPLL
jgi:hypothetical protein